jgi:hypothetical protein
MKKLLLFLLASVLTFGCSRDSVDDENVTLKRANVPIPCKGVVCMTEKEGIERMPVFLPGTEIPVEGVTMSREAWLSGHLTLMGNFQEQSSMTGLVAYLDLEAYAEGRIVLHAEYVARIFASNGDYVDLFSPITIEKIDDDRFITGTVLITGGSGRFENVSGQSVLNGIIPCWDIEGEWIFTR